MIERRGSGGYYSLKFDLCTSEELVNFDGIVVQNQGRNFGNCWNQKKENFYDPVIDDIMGICRFLDLKHCLKMNPWHSEKSCGDDGYDPCKNIS